MTLCCQAVFTFCDESGADVEDQEAANGKRHWDGGLGSYDLIFMDQHMASTEKQMLGTETVSR
jgi:hypothetical protein